MLGKVMKYEMRFGARILLPLFGLALAGSALMRLLLLIAPYIWEPIGNIFNVLAGMLGSMLLVAVVVVAVVVVLVRFYRSMVAEEGYLSFTLPVKTSTHIWARLVVGTLWLLLSIVVAVCCGLIFIPNFAQSLFSMGAVELAGSSTWSLTWGDLTFGIQASIIGLVVFFILLAIVTNLLNVYAAFAIGSQFSRGKVAGSIAAYLLLNMAQAFLMLPLLAIPAVALIGHSNAELMAYIDGLYVMGDPLATMGNVMGFLWLLVGVVAVVSLLFAVIHYFITHYFFNRRLNLE